MSEYVINNYLLYKYIYISKVHTFFGNKWILWKSAYNSYHIETIVNFLRTFCVTNIVFKHRINLMHHNHTFKEYL